MKKHFLFIGACALMGITTIASCSKEKQPDPITNNPVPNNPNNNNSGNAQSSVPVNFEGDGVLGSIIMRSYVSNPMLPLPVITETDIAFASFYNSSDNLTEAGTVSVNGKALTKADNHAYIFTPSATTLESLQLRSNVSWNVSGAGAVDAFSYDYQDAFPEFNGTLPSEVDRNSDLVIELGSNVENADSVHVFFLIDGSHKLLKSAAGNAARISFTSEELKTLNAVSNNSAMLQVNPMRYTTLSSGGRSYVFIKQEANVSMVNIK